MTEGLLKLNECMLGLGSDASANIGSLAAFAGRLLGATQGYFAYLDGSKLNVLGGPPSRACRADPPGALLCRRAIAGRGDEVLVSTAYANGTSPELRSYACRVVRRATDAVGALCLVFDGDASIGENGPALLGAFAAAIALEEERHRELAAVHEREARHRMSALGAMSAGVAHEINNPLTCVITNLDLAQEELAARAGALPDDTLAEIRQMLADAGEGAERVRSIARGLRGFSREAQGGATASAVDPRRALESALVLVASELRQRARLTVELGETPVVRARGSNLTEVFLNLLMNAAQSLPGEGGEGGEIRVRAGTDSAGRALVEVNASGRAIPPEALDRIFDPFFTPAQGGRHPGAGLPLCRDIVHGFGGEINVTSKIGQGTTFSVVLPPEPPGPAGGTGAVSAAPRAGDVARRPRILIIDDEVILAEALKRILAREYQVEVAHDGREGLRRLTEEEGYDLVFCDLMMPDMTGMELHEEIRRTRGDLTERFVFMTGGAFTQKSRQFLESVPNAMIEKPFDISSIRSLVQSRIRARAANAGPVPS